MNRIVIIGNSGSGKTTLAKELGASRNLPVIHLDRLFWMPGSFEVKRPPGVVHAEIDQERQAPAWIVEGVFGELAQRFLERADHLVWLDLPWAACRANLDSRGPAQANDVAGFDRLMAWAGDYWTRTDLRSHAGHEKIFHDFPGAKDRITERGQLLKLV